VGSDVSGAVRKCGGRECGVGRIKGVCSSCSEAEGLTGSILAPLIENRIYLFFLYLGEGTGENRDTARNCRLTCERLNATKLISRIDFRKE